MLKLLSKGDNGKKDLVTLGLEEGNIEKLKDEQPIGFSASEVGLTDPRAILICYDGPDWRANKDSIASNPGIGFCFVFHDEQLDRLKSGEDLLVETPDYNFLFVYGKDSQTLCDRFKGGITHSTHVVTIGYAPGQAPELYFTQN